MDRSIAGDPWVLLFANKDHGEGKAGVEEGYSSETVGTDTGTHLHQVRHQRGCSTLKGSSSKTVCGARSKAAIATGDPAPGSTSFLPEQHEGLQGQVWMLGPASAVTTAQPPASWSHAADTTGYFWELSHSGNEHRTGAETCSTGLTLLLPQGNQAHTSSKHPAPL